MSGGERVPGRRGPRGDCGARSVGEARRDGETRLDRGARSAGEARTDGGTRTDGGATADADPAEADSVVPSIRDHPIRLAVGVVVLAAGFSVIVGFDLVPDMPDELLVVAVAAATVISALLLALGRVVAAVKQAEPSAVEYRRDVTVPGADVDAVLGRAIRGLGSSRLAARQDILERLQRAATSVYSRAERVPLATARDRVAEGTWTDDAVAARFLAGESSISSTTDQVRTALGRTSKLERNVDAVVRVLAGLAPGVTADGDAARGERDSRTGERDARAGERDSRAGERDSISNGRSSAPAEYDTTGTDRRAVDRRTGRWRGVTALALLAVGVGVFNGLDAVPPSLLVAAAAVVGVAAAVSLARPPALTVSVERELETETASPGERVTVTVTATNTGDAMLPDLRIVDGVPAGLLVVDGSPRFATALRAGESVAFSYVVEATRGDHAFEPTHLIARDFSGAVERERHVDAVEPTVLSCGLELRADADVPVHPQTARRVGRVVTDSGGSGVELHSVREYRRGDPLSRIDWNRVASTGEFATLQFREEHAATVVLLVDARQRAFVAPRVDARSALEWELEAADIVLSSLLAAGDSVGLAALSPDWCWLAPRGGAGQRARARRLLESHDAFDGRRPSREFVGAIEERRLRKELPPDAQLVVFSPLCDDDAVGIARSYHARGFPVTVVSPDATGSRTTGQRLAAVERAMRISRLRSAGVRVVDWDTDRPLVTAIEAAQRRWSA